MKSDNEQPEAPEYTISKLKERINILETTNQNLRDENKRILEQAKVEQQEQQALWIQTYNTTWDEIYEAIFNLQRTLTMRKLNRLVTVDNNGGTSSS